MKVAGITIATVAGVLILGTVLSSYTVVPTGYTDGTNRAKIEPLPKVTYKRKGSC